MANQRIENGAPVLLPACFGPVVATKGAQEEVDRPQMLELLSRHFTNDWGEMEDDDQKMNREAVKGCSAGMTDYGRIFSSYKLPGDLKVWIITYPQPAESEAAGDANRCNTCVMLPSEY